MTLDKEFLKTLTTLFTTFCKKCLIVECAFPAINLRFNETILKINYIYKGCIFAMFCFYIISNDYYSSSNWNFKRRYTFT